MLLTSVMVQCELMPAQWTSQHQINQKTTITLTLLMVNWWHHYRDDYMAMGCFHLVTLHSIWSKVSFERRCTFIFPAWNSQYADVSVPAKTSAAHAQVTQACEDTHVKWQG